MKIRGAGQRWNLQGDPGRGKKVRKSTDLKIRQKCVNCYWRICITVWCFDQGKHYILWLLDGLSANQLITSCTKDQMNSFSFISFISAFLAQMCGHNNMCNLLSALPRCAPRVLSIFAGRGGARPAFRGAGQPVFTRGGASIPGKHAFKIKITVIKKHIFDRLEQIIFNALDMEDGHIKLFLNINELPTTKGDLFVTKCWQRGRTIT